MPRAAAVAGCAHRSSGRPPHEPTARPDRQERARALRAQAPPQQGAPAVRRPAALPDLRPHALRPAPSALRPAAGARPQGQRRIRGAALPHPPPRPAPGRQRAGLVEGHRHRSPRRRAQALGTEPADRASRACAAAVRAASAAADPRRQLSPPSRRSTRRATIRTRAAPVGPANGRMP